MTTIGRWSSIFKAVPVVPNVQIVPVVAKNANGQGFKKFKVGMTDDIPVRIAEHEHVSRSQRIGGGHDIAALLAGAKIFAVKKAFVGL
jgi:hypothetical protein